MASIHFNKQEFKSSKEEFLCEIHSWDFSTFSQHSNQSNFNQSNFTQAPQDKFASISEYISYWTKLFFHDTQAKLYSIAKERLSLNQQLLTNIFSPTVSAILKGKSRLTFLLPSETFHSFNSAQDNSNLRISPLNWLCITSKNSVNEFIVNKSSVFPSFNLLARILSVSNFRQFDSSSAKFEIVVEIRPSSPAIFDLLKSKIGAEKNSLRRDTLVLIPLENLQSKLRQFIAIINIDSIRLREEILDPSLHSNALCQHRWQNVPEFLQEKFSRELNPSQFAAIKNALQTKGISLLQGPPGTGKTRTVIALLNLLHISAYNAYYKALLDWVNSLQSRPFNQKPSVASNIQNMSLDCILKESNCHSFDGEEIISRKRPRILVCAPSNAAVDEIVDRLAITQLFDGSNKPYTPRMIRVGRSHKIRGNIQFHLSLQNNVSAFFSYSPQALNERLEEYQRKLRHIKRAILERRRRFAHFFDNSAELAAHEIEAQMYLKMYEDKNQIHLECRRLSWVKTFGRDVAQKKLEESFLNQAEIVFCTLNSAGGREFTNLSKGFDFCIVDEAAQCTEPELLIPLQLQVHSAILVGDHRQLPPTVFSLGLSSTQIEQSLFERFQSVEFSSKFLLDTQYRMHPEIAKFPARHFYSSLLKNGSNVFSPQYNKVFHSHPKFAPYLFYNVSGSEIRSKSSLMNVQEAIFIARLLEELFLTFGPSAFSSVGIITPYKEQSLAISKRLEHSSNLGKFLKSKAIEVSTVDFFQGQEREIIILSCVRASSSSIGFVADLRRLNVSITRAKTALWVVGDWKALQRSKDWAEMIQDAKQRNLFRNGNFVPRLENCFVDKRARVNRNYASATVVAKGNRHRGKSFKRG